MSLERESGVMCRCLLVVVILSQFHAVQCQLVEAPVSSAVFTGQSVTLPCRSENNDTTLTYEWQFTPIDKGPILVVHDCQVNPSYVDLYQTAVSPDGGCNMVLKSTKGGMAGTYTCQHGFDQGSADIVVLSSNSSCSYSPNDLVSGDQVTFTCYVNYNGTVSPKMRWKADNGAVMNNATVNTYQFQVNSRLTIPVYPPKSRMYNCETYFSPPFTFSFIWYSPSIDIQHPPTTLTITATGYICNQLYANRTTLVCSSNGFPAPSYTWFDHVTEQTIPGNTVVDVGAGDGRYECTASNVIRGETFTASTVAPFNITDEIPPTECPTEAPTTPATTTTTTTTPEPTTPVSSGSVCGAILHEAPNGTLATPGWNLMCYISRDVDVDQVGTQCRDLIQNIPPDIVDYNNLLQRQGNFGCVLSQRDDFSNSNYACFDDYQQGIQLSNCPTCLMMYVCIKLPPAYAQAQQHYYMH